MGDKILYLQHVFASAANLGLGVESSILIAIAVLACLFGAEVAGICILIRKMSFAKRDRLQKEFEEEYIQRHTAEDDAPNYAIVALSFGAIPFSTQLAFFIVAAAAALGALVFAVTLIVYFAKGYALVSAESAKESEAEAAAVAEESAYAVTEDYEPDESEEQAQEAYITAEESFAEVFSADAEEEVAYEDEPAYEEAVAHENAPEIAEEDVAVVAEAPVAVEPRVVPAAGASGPMVGSIPVYSSAYPGGQMPYVEKYISETYKEVIKETTTTTTTPAAKAEDRYSPATEEILKAIAELMKISSQIRAGQEMAVENPSLKKDEDAPAAVDAEEEDEEIEEIDSEEEEDEIESEEGDQKESGDEDGEDEYESDLFSGSERIVGFDEETGCYIVAHYRKSFEAKLIQSRRNVKKYYSAIKNALLAYEGTKDRITWTINNYNNDHTQIAKINVRTRTLDLYLALDPATLEDSVYHGRDVSDKKKYAETPFLYKVNSPRKLTLALELVQRACEEQGLSPIDIETVNYEEQYPFDTTENLVSRGLIREYLREEKPAVTFELDPDHVPQLPEEDGSVIPVNANFTWEFDNEQPEKAEESVVEEVTVEEPIVEEQVVEEPIVEETVAEEPAPVETVVEETVAGTTTITHETVKTTERHYTERYVGYGMSGQMPYQPQLSTNAQPIEALAVPSENHETLKTESPVVVEVTAEETLVSEPVVEKPISDEPVAEEAEAVIEEATEPEEVFVWEPLAEGYEDETEEVYEDETEEAYEDETEEAYEDETEEVYEDETEEVYEDETEEAYEDETEEVYEDEAEEVYEDEAEEVYEDETEEVYEDEAEEVYEDEAEEVYEDEGEEFYEDEAEEVYEDEGEEFYEDEAEETYEDETEETYEDEAEEAPAPQVASNSNPSVALLDVCTFDDYFENGATIDLEALKSVGLAPESAVTLKVYASGALKGKFTVEANHFTLDAIKAIGDADGDSIMIR